MSRDQYEREVQRRYTELMASGGVDEGRASMEVLFLLPPEFTRAYAELFEMAVSWSPQTAGGGGKDEGRVKSSGKSDSGDQFAGGMNTRNIKAANAGGGKRWHRKHWSIRSESAVNSKRKLDRALVRLAKAALEAAKEADKELRKQNEQKRRMGTMDEDS